MTQNIFKFGDTYWVQKNGTAMGTSCVVNYLFLYIGLLKKRELLEDFELRMPFYAWFIDNRIGVWFTHVPGSARVWSDFLQRINSWAPLRWTNTGHVDSLEFLDLTVSITSTDTLAFCTYQKPMNLNLYLPPTSAHPLIIYKALYSAK